MNYTWIHAPATSDDISHFSPFQEPLPVNGIFLPTLVAAVGYTHALVQHWCHNEVNVEKKDDHSKCTKYVEILTHEKNQECLCKASGKEKWRVRML